MCTNLLFHLEVAVFKGAIGPGGYFLRRVDEQQVSLQIKNVFNKRVFEVQGC